MRGGNIISCVLCGPCICAWLSLTFCFCPSRLRRHTFTEEDKACFERRQFSAPRPCPLRKRALTIPLPNVEASEKQTTYEQADSPLFKLPLELREAIYTAILGDKTIHVIRKHRRLGHLRCKAQSQQECPVVWDASKTEPRQSCMGLLDKDGVWPDNDHFPTDGDIIPFLQTCRRIYSEAIPILYSTNTFAFRDLDCIRHLSASILPSRLHAIRSLEITWNFRWPSYDSFAQRLLAAPMYPPHDEASWEDCWRIIAGMKALRNISVTVRDSSNISDADKEKKMLLPLWKVQHVPNFTISLEWPGRNWSPAPFKVVRPDLSTPSESEDE